VNIDETGWKTGGNRRMLIAGDENEQAGCRRKVAGQQARRTC